MTEKEDRMRKRERESTKYLNFVYALGRKREITAWTKEKARERERKMSS